MAVNKENNRAEHFLSKIMSVLSVLDNIDKDERKEFLKINYLGLHTGKKVSVSEKFLSNQELKSTFIIELEKILGREVKLGTKHIYIGDKLM